MFYTEKSKCIIHNNSIDDINHRPHCISDLEVTFDDKLSFLPHIDNIVCFAYKTLRFVNRKTKDFNDTNICLMIYILISYRLYKGNFKIYFGQYPARESAHDDLFNMFNASINLRWL